MRVLLVEPDSATAQSIELMLKSEGMNVYTTDLGEEAVDLAKLYDYDIMLLELNLPDMSGYEVLRTVRLGKVKTPIMVVSGVTGVQDKVRALGFGADDHLGKPFHKDELVGRIHTIVRRAKGHAESVIKTGNMTVYLDRRSCQMDDKPVHLTGKEYQMLELLSLRKGTCLTKEMFLNHLYGGMDEPELKIIDVFICKLRKKLSQSNTSEEHNRKHFIETIWGRGYLLSEDAPAPPLSSYSARSYSGQSGAGRRITKAESLKETELLRAQMAQLKAELGASPEASLEETIRLLQGYKNKTEGMLEDAVSPSSQSKTNGGSPGLPALQDVREQFSDSTVKKMPGFVNGVRMPVGMVFQITSLLEINTDEGLAANLKTGEVVTISPAVGMILELMTHGQGHKINKSNLINYIFEDHKPQNEARLGSYMSQAQGALTQLVGRDLASSIVQVFSGGNYGMPRIDGLLESRGEHTAQIAHRDRLDPQPFIK